MVENDWGLKLEHFKPENEYNRPDDDWNEELERSNAWPEHYKLEPIVHSNNRPGHRENENWMDWDQNHPEPEHSESEPHKSDQSGHDDNELHNESHEHHAQNKPEKPITNKPKQLNQGQVE